MNKMLYFILRSAYLIKGALQLLMNRCGYIRFAHVHKRVSTNSFVVLIIGNSKSNHLGAQDTFNMEGSMKGGYQRGGVTWTTAGGLIIKVTVFIKRANYK